MSSGGRCRPIVARPSRSKCSSGSASMSCARAMASSHTPEDTSLDALRRAWCVMRPSMAHCATSVWNHEDFMETNGEWFESEDERTMRLLETDLESLANVLEDLTAALADLLTLLRQPKVELQF